MIEKVEWIEKPCYDAALARIKELEAQVKELNDLVKWGDNLLEVVLAEKDEISEELRREREAWGRAPVS